MNINPKDFERNEYERNMYVNVSSKYLKLLGGAAGKHIEKKAMRNNRIVFLFQSLLHRHHRVDTNKHALDRLNYSKTKTPS